MLSALGDTCYAAQIYIIVERLRVDAAKIGFTSPTLKTSPSSMICKY